jgi:hypothetical protein
MSTERRHTKNGLQLNKKGKVWIVNNLVKEIRTCIYHARYPHP